MEEKLSSSVTDEKENEKKRGENGENRDGIGTLSPVDIENITNLVQGELCSIRQIIETNRMLMNQIKVSTSVRVTGKRVKGRV